MIIGKPTHESIDAGLAHVRSSDTWEACLNIDIADGPMLQCVPADGDLNIAGDDEQLRDALADEYAAEVVDDGLGYTVIRLRTDNRATTRVLEEMAVLAGDSFPSVSSQTVFHDDESLREQFTRSFGGSPGGPQHDPR
jgi:hypothetical protein